MIVQVGCALNSKCSFATPFFRQLGGYGFLRDLCVSVVVFPIFYLRVVRYSTTSRNSDGAIVLARFSGMLLCLVSAIWSMSSVRMVSCLPPAMRRVTESFVFEVMKPTSTLPSLVMIVVVMYFGSTFLLGSIIDSTMS